MNRRATSESPYSSVVVDEGVGVALEQRHVGVHPRALHAGSGLGMKVAKTPFWRAISFTTIRTGHDRVGHGQGVGVAQVDLVLAGGVLVLGCARPGCPSPRA